VIILIAALSVIFYFRNFYSGGREPEAGGRLPEAGEGLPEAGDRLPEAGGRGPEAGGRGPETVGRQDSAVGSQQPSADGERQTANSKPPTVIASSEGKHLFQLAREVYGNPYLWVLIYKANAEKITDPDNLISGKELIIPGLEGKPDKLTHADSLNVAEGYRLVSEFYRQKDDIRAKDFEKAFRRFQPQFIPPKTF
jgi:hypothetical protein